MFRPFPIITAAPYLHDGENSRRSERAAKAQAQARARSGQAFEEGPGAAHARQGGAAGAAADGACARRLAQSRHRPANRRTGRARGPAGRGSQTGLKPPADNPSDRRADFSAAHRARKSTAQGLGEAPQTPYRSARLGELDPDLAKALGIHDDDSALPEAESAPAAARDPRRATLRGITGATATVHALETLLREGRPEFSERPWTPHRPPRPEKSEGGVRLVIKSNFAPKGDQPQAIADIVEGVKRQDRTQVLLGVTGSGKTFTMAKVIEATQRPAL